MKVIRGYTRIAEPLAATIGNFDGVHLGHQAMLAELVKQATKRQLPVAVIVFEPQPAEFFSKDQPPARLFSLREKVAEFARCNVDYTICLPFTSTLAKLKAREFSSSVVFGRLGIRYLLVGQDFRYGCNREGDYPLLAADAQQAGAVADCFPDCQVLGNRVSSTRIRRALMDADFPSAEALLGHPYRLCGRVIYGAQRGQAWGIPTANIALHRRHSVLHGVYHVRVHRSNGQSLPAIANIGTRPTVDGSKAYLEAHILNFNASLYGEMLQVEFLHKHRDEKKFSSIEALIAQIRCDIQSCYDFFSTAPQTEKQ